MTAHAQMGMSLAYSSDGRRLASIDVEGVVRVWASDLDDLIATAERGLTRELTEMECRQYLHRTSC